MKILDELDRLRAEATRPPWYSAKDGDEFIALFDSEHEYIFGARDDDNEESNAAFVLAAISALPDLIAIARAASEVYDHEMSWCVVTPSCGNCPACRLRAALARLAARSE